MMCGLDFLSTSKAFDVTILVGLWGANSHGQLAIGSTEDKDAPTRVLTSLKPDFITGGGIFSALVANSTIWVAGQLEPKEEIERQVTLRMLDQVDEGIKVISCGWDFLIVLSKTGKVYFRGHNSPGFIFNNSTPSWVGTLSPIALDVVEAKHIAAGLRHAVVVSGTDKVFECKNAKVREVVVDNTSEILGCVAGARHSALWTDDGCIGVWGDMRFGQGGPVASKANGLPRKTDCVQWISSGFFLNERIVDVKSGWSHILALTESGKVFSWGRCDLGQLGRTVNGLTTATTIAWPQSSRVFDPTPQPVSLPTSSVRSISAGAEHCLALIAETQVWMWGWNEHGNCGTVAAAADAASVVVEGDAPSPPFPERQDWCVVQPRLVSFAEKGNVLSAAACYGYSMALTDA